MSTTELERRLADVLQRHAEDAMSRTNTEERLAELLEEERAEAKRRRTHRVIGALVAAAAVAALTFWVAARATDDAEPEPVEPISPERVATEYLQAAASYDVRLAESYFAEDADLGEWGGVEGWRSTQLWNQAIALEIDPGTCVGSASVQPAITRVECPYVFRVMGSDALGLGPYEGSSYVFTVRDGAIVTVTDHFEFLTNGYNMQIAEPFRIWVEDNYPQDYDVMYVDDGASDVSDDESNSLWREHLSEFIAAKLAEQ